MSCRLLILLEVVSNKEKQLYNSTKLQSKNKYSHVPHKKGASIKTHEDFCEVSFDVPPGKPTEEMYKRNQPIESILKLMDKH